MCDNNLATNLHTKSTSLKLRRTSERELDMLNNEVLNG